MRLNIGDLLTMQRELQEKYKGKWSPIAPENARNQLLWGIGEIGEMIDIIKKRGDDAILCDADTRRAFLEETVDVMMYLMDVLLCYDVDADEFSGIYAAKHAHNMKRRFEGTDYSQEDLTDSLRWRI